MNGQAVYEVLRNCDGVREIRTDSGFWSYVVPKDSLTFTVKGKALHPGSDVVILTNRRTERQQKLWELMVKSKGVTLWTMPDLCYALGVRNSRRMKGEIGKDLKRLGFFSRRVGDNPLRDPRTKKLLNYCRVYAIAEITEEAITIRRRYEREASARIAQLNKVIPARLRRS